MIVFYKERLAFLSVPKTGTTAYQTALRDRADIIISGPPELKHAPVYRYNRFIRPMFEKACNAELELMAVMREPLSWLGSWYRYRRRPAMEGHVNSTHNISFDDFVRAWATDDPVGYANVGSQAQFLQARPNGTAITYYFRYENQSRLQGFLENRLKIKLDVKQENVSPQMPLALSPDVAAEVRRKKAAEFELYASIE